MVASPAQRLVHIKDSIDNIRRLLAGKTMDEVSSQVDVRAAVERFLEIVSEASRHVPEEWKSAFGPDVPWWEIAAFGNILRHTYDQVDLSIVWHVYQSDLDPLERAVDAMIAEHGSKEGRS